MTLLPPSKLIVPPSKLLVTIFASEGGVLMRGVIVPPSKLIVTWFLSPKGGFLLRGGEIIYSCLSDIRSHLSYTYQGQTILLNVYGWNWYHGNSNETTTLNNTSTKSKCRHDRLSCRRQRYRFCVVAPVISARCARPTNIESFVMIRQPCHNNADDNDHDNNDDICFHAGEAGRAEIYYHY